MAKPAHQKALVKHCERKPPVLLGSPCPWAVLGQIPNPETGDAATHVHTNSCTLPPPCKLPG